jgi:anion-transporting  ArsA/GET3 family ATPase
VSVAPRLAGKRICICAGSGGVGKTTISAALAIGLAARGARVGVVTIDPARRLAQSLGLAQLGNEPRLVDPALFAAAGVEIEGELWAMMLDPKQTFDEMVARLAPDASTREEVFHNRIYQQLSNAVAGSQEFSAVAKLHELHGDARFDALVLDTPPSRNALDFLEAPSRLTSFLEGRAVRILLAPPGLASKIVGRGTGLVFSVLRRVTGVDLLTDISAFLRALGGVLDGFREQADAVGALLRDRETTFLIVSSPEREPVEEAIFFRDQLRRHDMPFGGLIVNRVQPAELLLGDPARARGELAAQLGDRLAERVIANATDFRSLAERDRASIDHLKRELEEPSPVLIEEQAADVYDLASLGHVAAALFAGD